MKALSVLFSLLSLVQHIASQPLRESVRGSDFYANFIDDHEKDLVRTIPQKYSQCRSPFLCYFKVRKL